MFSAFLFAYIHSFFSISRRKTIKLNKQSMRVAAQRCDVMISYARQEAAEQALQLKEKLRKNGYVVYLVNVFVSIVSIDLIINNVVHLL